MSLQFTWHPFFSFLSSSDCFLRNHSFSFRMKRLAKNSRFVTKEIKSKPKKLQKYLQAIKKVKLTNLVQKVNRIFGLPQFVWPHTRLGLPSVWADQLQGVLSSNPQFSTAPSFKKCSNFWFIVWSRHFYAPSVRVSGPGFRQRETLCCAFRNFQMEKS